MPTIGSAHSGDPADRGQKSPGVLLTVSPLIDQSHDLSFERVHYLRSYNVRQLRCAFTPWVPCWCFFWSLVSIGGRILTVIKPWVMDYPESTEQISFKTKLMTFAPYVSIYYQSITIFFCGSFILGSTNKLTYFETLTLVLLGYWYETILAAYLIEPFRFIDSLSKAFHTNLIITTAKKPWSELV